MNRVDGSGGAKEANDDEHVEEEDRRHKQVEQPSEERCRYGGCENGGKEACDGIPEMDHLFPHRP